MFRQKLISIVLAATVFTSTLMTVPVSAAGTDTGSVSAPSNIFTDDFNDGNADGWNVYTGNNGGTWTVNNANQFAVSSCNGGKAIANGTSFQDLIYEADVTATSDGSGFLFRVTNVSGGVSDGYNGYFIGLRGSKSLQLGRVTGAAGNTWKELKTQNVPYSNGHLKVVAVGNNIKVYLNNIQYIDYTDNDGSQITSSGAIGLRTWNGAAQFDNIYVRDYYSQTTPAPQYSVPDGVYGTGQTVELTAATTDAAIRYTTDGSMPNSSSPLYTGPLNISDNTEIKSIAVRDGETPSDVTSSLYVLGNESVAVDDDFQDGDKSSYTAYTGNTASPWVGTQTEADGVYTFTQPRGDKAINNSVSVQDFILEGDINPAASGQSSGFVFRVSNPDNGCDDMDGYFAGINNNGYIEICKFASTGTGVWTSIKNVPAVVNANQNNHLKIVGIGQHFWIYLNNVLATEFTDTSYSEGSVGLRAWNDNGTVTYDNLKVYNIKSLKQQAATPVISPAAGVFRNSQEITISCDTPDAKIYYTTDGSKPTTGSQLYNGAFTLSQSATIKAIAVKDGMTDSEVQSSVYTKATSDFSDDFNDNNMDGWKTYDGTWNTSDGSLNVGAGQGYKAVANGLDFSNFTYEADVTLSGGGSTDNAGLIFRVSDPSVGPDSLKGYYAGIRNPATSGVTNDGSVQVGRFNNGWTELASIPYPITSNKAYHLKVEAKGQNIEVYVDGVHVVSVTDNMWKHGTIGVRDWKLNAKFDNISAKDTGDYTDPVYDWSGVKGAVFVPTNAVDEIQEWKFYDHDINDRELSYAHDYGINTVRVFLHYLNWKNDKTNFMNNIEDFLKLTDKYGIKTELVFFDDCWNDHPDWDTETADLAPRYGAHNSRWLECPGDDVKSHYNDADGLIKADLKAYVQDIVNAHKDDDRVAFWNIYNEPNNGESGLMSQVTTQIMNDARMWVKETGCTKPVTSTGGAFTGAPFSDFITFHPYDSSYPNSYPDRDPKTVLADECMNRSVQTVPGIVENYGNKGMGYIMWELGIGRDNCRFPWGSDVNPLTSEVTMPFHGIVYPDGHPWDVNDVKALLGETAFSNLPVFHVNYYKDNNFTDLAKSSITPRIDFDLGNEKGTGSPDASVGIGEDNFSIRWAGYISPAQTGTYTFYAKSDNVARIWVGNTQVVNKTSNKLEEANGTVNLTAGQKYYVKIEYSHLTGDSSMHVNWSGPSLDKTVLLPVLSTSSVSSVQLNSKTLNLKIGESQKLSANIEPMDAANQNVTWSSDNAGIVKVDQTGTVKALTSGTATITVTTEDGNFVDSCVVTVPETTTFRNPIVTRSTGAGSADPSVVFKDGYYYYAKVDNDKAIQIARAKRLQDVGTSPRITVYTPPAGQVYSNELWAPELTYINGKWYIYFTAGAGANHRMYVLEANSQDPQGEYTFKGQIADSTNKWAIDGTVFQTDDGSMYMVWSGWQGDTDGEQDLYIAPMSDPWTISGDRVLISKPDQTWERKAGPAYINEGPEVLKKNGKIFIVYSGSGSWSDDYCLGMLTYSGTDTNSGSILNADNWKKSNGPVFSKSTNGAFGTGHNSFTVSPDGTEDWIVYHADKNSGGSWGDRSVRAQKFTWNQDGTPNFGTPVDYNAEVEQPSGTPEVDRVVYEAEDAILGGNAVNIDTGDASGGKVVGHIDNAGSDYVLFNVSVKKAGTYTMTVMADNGSDGGTAEQTVTVNGGADQTISYNKYGWGVFNPSWVNVDLKAGLNTIKLSKKTNFAEIDCIALDLASSVPVASITVGSQNGSSISQKGGTLQLTAVVAPDNATDNRVTWSIVTGSNLATISSDGLLTALANGTVTVKAVSKDGYNIESNAFTVTITGQGTSDNGGSGNNGSGNSGSGSGNNGGSSSGNGSTGTVTPPDKGNSGTTQPEKKNFTDMSGHQWANEAVTKLAEAGIISGTSENSFSPAKNITRADFMVLLVKALNLKAEVTDNFTDVSSKAYYYNAVGIAKKLGIANGTGNNEFDPKSEITREDMMVLVVKALGIAGIDLKAGTASDMAGFTDGAKVSAYAQEAVATLVREGIIKGSGSMINPKNELTRAEAAVVIYKIFNLK